MPEQRWRFWPWRLWVCVTCGAELRDDAVSAHLDEHGGGVAYLTGLLTALRRLRIHLLPF